MANSYKTSVRFDSYKFYTIKCWNKDKTEIFYKVGITYRKLLGERFSINMKPTKAFPYYFKIINVLEFKYNEGEKCWNIEKEYHNERNKLGERYYPKMEMNGGITECYLTL